jgi:hypothetical protein
MENPILGSGGEYHYDKSDNYVTEETYTCLPTAVKSRINEIGIDCIRRDVSGIQRRLPWRRMQRFVQTVTSSVRNEDASDRRHRLRQCLIVCGWSTRVVEGAGRSMPHVGPFFGGGLVETSKSLPSGLNFHDTSDKLI